MNERIEIYKEEIAKLKITLEIYKGAAEIAAAQEREACIAVLMQLHEMQADSDLHDHYKFAAKKLKARGEVR